MMKKAKESNRSFQSKKSLEPTQSTKDITGGGTPALQTPFNHSQKTLDLNIVEENDEIIRQNPRDSMDIDTY